MQYSISVAITHTPWDIQRRANVIELQANMSGAENHWLVSDQGPRNPPNAWPNQRQAWLNATRCDSTHFMVLHDDISVCRDFIPGVLAQIQQRPDDVLSLFSNHELCAEAKESQDTHWLALPYGLWGQAIVMPRENAISFLGEYWDRAELVSDWDNHESRIRIYLESLGKSPLQPVPSLVNHLPFPSMLGHDTAQPTVARWHIGDESPLAIDWSKGADNPKGGTNDNR